MSNNNQIDPEVGLQWDEYGNPSPLTKRAKTVMGKNNDDNNNPDEQYEQYMIDYNRMEEESEINDIIEMQLLNDMMDEQTAMMQLVSVLDDIQSMMHELTLDERNELIDELTHLYERFK